MQSSCTPAFLITVIYFKLWKYFSVILWKKRCSDPRWNLFLPCYRSVVSFCYSSTVDINILTENICGECSVKLSENKCTVTWNIRYNFLCIEAKWIHDRVHETYSPPKIAIWPCFPMGVFQKSKLALRETLQFCFFFFLLQKLYFYFLSVNLQLQYKNAQILFSVLYMSTKKRPLGHRAIIMTVAT